MKSPSKKEREAMLLEIMRDTNVPRDEAEVILAIELGESGGDCIMVNEYGEELVPIRHPEIPDAVRDHAASFNPPAMWVADMGDDEYLLYDKNGELLDMIALEMPRKSLLKSFWQLAARR